MDAAAGAAACDANVQISQGGDQWPVDTRGMTFACTPLSHVPHYIKERPFARRLDFSGRRSRASCVMSARQESGSVKRRACGLAGRDCVDGLARRNKVRGSTPGLECCGPEVARSGNLGRPQDQMVEWCRCLRYAV
jgi:hypothetical protein